MFDNIENHKPLIGKHGDESKKILAEHMKIKISSGLQDRRSYTHQLWFKKYWFKKVWVDECNLESSRCPRGLAEPDKT